MKMRTKLKILIGAVTIGGLAVYLFDPSAGARRRERITQALENRARDVRDAESKAERVVEAVTDPDAVTDPASEPQETSAQSA